VCRSDVTPCRAASRECCLRSWPPSVRRKLFWYQRSDLFWPHRHRRALLGNFSWPHVDGWIERALWRRSPWFRRRFDRRSCGAKRSSYRVSYSASGASSRRCTGARTTCWKQPSVRGRSAAVAGTRAGSAAVDNRHAPDATGMRSAPPLATVGGTRACRCR
jgi:hypothetical protein